MAHDLCGANLVSCARASSIPDAARSVVPKSMSNSFLRDARRGVSRQLQTRIARCGPSGPDRHSWGEPQSRRSKYDREHPRPVCEHSDGSFSRSSLRKKVAWAWAFRYPAPSLQVLAARYARRTEAAGAHSDSGCGSRGRGALERKGGRQVVGSRPRRPLIATRCGPVFHRALRRTRSRPKNASRPAPGLGLCAAQVPGSGVRAPYFA